MKNNEAINLLNTTSPTDLSLDDILDFIDNHQGAGKGAAVASTKPMFVDTKELIAMMSEVKNNQVISLARLGVRLLKEKKEVTLFNMDEIAKPYIMKRVGKEEKAYVNQPATFPASYTKNKEVNPDNKALDIVTWSHKTGLAYVQLPSKSWETYAAFLLGQTNQTTSDVNAQKCSRAFRVFRLNK
jgi:hypothetical protein